MTDPTLRRIEFTFLAILIVLGLAASVARNAVWRSPVGAWNDAVAKAPAKARPWYQLGLAYARAGERDLAIVYLGRAKKLDPVFFRSKTPKAEDYQQQGMLEDAEVEYRARVRESPGDPVLHNRLGCVLYGLGRTGEADREFKTALALDPSYAEAYANRAAVEFDAGAFLPAFEDLRRAVSLKPESVELHLRLAVTLERLGRNDEAAAEYAAALMRDPGSGEARNSLERLTGRETSAGR
ncbi:MAG: tetratricopeptide repeat protein [Nitrospiraceae bacterium]|nr:tetratricopeptide repeat protein [Nitrospiraceae bacterium]